MCFTVPETAAHRVTFVLMRISHTHRFVWGSVQSTPHTRASARPHLPRPRVCRPEASVFQPAGEAGGEGDRVSAHAQARTGRFPTVKFSKQSSSVPRLLFLPLIQSTPVLYFSRRPSSSVPLYHSLFSGTVNPRFSLFPDDRPVRCLFLIIFSPVKSNLDLV